MKYNNDGLLTLHQLALIIELCQIRFYLIQGLFTSRPFEGQMVKFNSLELDSEVIRLVTDGTGK